MQASTVLIASAYPTTPSAAKKNIINGYRFITLFLLDDFAVLLPLYLYNNKVVAFITVIFAAQDTFCFAGYTT